MAHQVQAVLDGFNKWDYDALRATRSDDFIYQFLPLSLGAPPRNNDVYAAFFADVLTPLFDEFVVWSCHRSMSACRYTYDVTCS